LGGVLRGVEREGKGDKRKEKEIVKEERRKRRRNKKEVLFCSIGLFTNWVFFHMKPVVSMGR
jgi:hypothetical protein